MNKKIIVMALMALAGAVFAADNTLSVQEDTMNFLCALFKYSKLIYFGIIAISFLVAGAAFILGRNTGSGLQYALNVLGGMLIVLILFAAATKLLGSAFDFEAECPIPNTHYTPPADTSMIANLPAPVMHLEG